MDTEHHLRCFQVEPNGVHEALVRPTDIQAQLGEVLTTPLVHIVLVHGLEVRDVESKASGSAEEEQVGALKRCLVVTVGKPFARVV